GLLPEQEYQCGELGLNKDDLLVACTDGITEAMDSGGNEFGRARLAELGSRLRALGPQEVLDGVLEAVNAHGAGGVYEDDRILMVLKGLKKASVLRPPQGLEKSEYAFSKFVRFVAESRSVVCMRNAPEFLWSACGTQDHFTVAAGQCVVFLVAN